MAQVRKFQSGGKTFKINGKTYNTSNSEDMKRLEEMASNSEYGGIAQQILANVNDAAYDNTLNVYRTSDGRVMMDGGLQHIADQYMSQGTQRATQRKDNVFNNTFKRRSGKDWINNLDSFLNAFDSKPTTSSSSTDGKIKISGVSGLGGQWKYNDQGWDEADINNAAMLKEWQLLEDYYNDSLTLSKEDLDKKYDISGLDKRSLEAYMNMRKTTPDLYSKYIDSFKPDAAVLDNDDFYSTYGWFGFTQNPDLKKANDTKALKEYLATQGLDFEGAENVFYRDKDGNLMVTDAFLTNVLGGDRIGHYWLNDNWANLKTDNGNTNPYSQMRDHIIWNGRIYKQDDAAVLAELQKSGYIDANKAYDAARAEQIMRTQWSDNPTFAHEAYDPETSYSEWAHGYKDKGLRYRTLESNLGKGRNLVGYYTNDDPTDNYGLRTERFAIIGDDGKLIQDNVDPSTIAKTTNGQYIPGTTYFMTERLGQDAGALAGTYIDGTSIDGKPSNTFFYKNPTTGEFFIQDPDLKGNQKGKAVRIPKEIAAMIPDEAWEYFRTNKAAKDRLFKIIRDFTNTGFGKYMRNFHPIVGLESFREDLLRRDFRKAGLSRDQADQIVDLFNKWGRNSYYKKQTGKYDASSAARQQAFLADPQTEEIVQPFKDGGKIEKHQYGKVLGQQGKTELKTINLKESDRKDASTGQSRGLGSKDSKQWSSLDTAELLATVGDLSSLALSLVPGAHLGAAGVGGAASTAQFVTDIKRDGFQGKDALNYAVNLGFDALSGLTGAGGKVAKIMKNFPTMAKVLQKAIKAGAIVGVGDAVYNTINKIAKGESFTLSDVRRIANGVAGGITLGKTGLFNQTKGRRVKTDPSIIKGKKAETPEIKLDVKKIEAASKADQLIELQSQVTAGYRAKNKGTKLTDDQILELYDIPTKKTTDFKWKVWKSSREVVPDLKSKSTRSTLSETELDDLAAKRNGFQNWFFGTGKKQRLFNGMFEGNNPLTRQEIVMPENTTPGLISLNVPAVVRQVPGIRSSYINLPNFGSRQQFPQEMEFTENVSTVPMKRLVFKGGGVLKAKKGMGGRPTKDGNNSVDWNYIAREALDAGNMLRAIGDARKFKNISDRQANAIAALAPDVWQDKGRARFQTITPNLVNGQIAKNNTFAGTINTADSALNLAGKLNIAEMNNELSSNANRAVSEEYNNSMQQDAARRMQSDQFTFQTNNARKQFMIAPTTSKFAGETELITNMGDIANKSAVKWQNYLNSKGLTSVVAQNKIDQLKLMKAQPGLTEAQIKAIDDQIATINSDEYQNILARQNRYGNVSSAKKGTKLRPFTEQMLLDNNKIVAKAISKLNDNTMKLILKAMS